VESNPRCGFEIMKIGRRCSGSMQNASPCCSIVNRAEAAGGAVIDGGRGFFPPADRIAGVKTRQNA
jgi:hypothetical protein